MIRGMFLQMFKTEFIMCRLLALENIVIMTATYIGALKFLNL